jgi:predicted small metal-binding protein
VGGIEQSIGRRPAMPKELRCGDLMPGCSAVVQGKDEAEVMAKATEHAKKEHGLSAIPPDVAAKAKAAIKNK